MPAHTRAVPASTQHQPWLTSTSPACSSACSPTPDVQPDSSPYLLRSQCETRAKGKIGQSFWAGSPSHCSPRPPLHQQRTQQPALPRAFQTAKIPTQSMSPRGRLSVHPLGDTGEFPTDSINHLSAMWSYYISYCPFDTLHFPEESAPVLCKLAYPTANTGHLQRILLRPWSLWQKTKEILSADTILIN